MTAEALVYTSRGNLPASDLEYFTDRQDEKDQIVFIEGYRLKATGEEVQRSAHVLPLAPWQTGKRGRIAKMQLKSSVGAVS